MSNKIEGAGMPNVYRLTPADQQDVARAGGDRGAPVAAVPQSDSVRLSGEGVSLQSLQRQDAGTPFDAAKVAALRAAIDDGSYTVDARAIAQRLLADEHALP